MVRLRVVSHTALSSRRGVIHNSHSRINSQAVISSRAPISNSLCRIRSQVVISNRAALNNLGRIQVRKA
jgi:hypothetical protein